jgi:hypothetical protein
MYIRDFVMGRRVHAVVRLAAGDQSPDYRRINSSDLTIRGPSFRLNEM